MRTKLISILSALICACLLCIGVSAEELPVQTDIPEIAPKEETPVLLIDNMNVYENMQQSYAQGYEPMIVGEEAIIVLPLCCTHENRPESLRLSVRLEPDSPFIVKNYEQTVPLALHTDTSGIEHTVYLAEVRLAMYMDRVNGCYPVQLQVAEFDTFTVYVNITDGIDPNAEEPAPPPETAPPEEPVILMPKILVQGVSGGDIQAGETAELHVILKNTSRTESLQNLTVTASASAPIQMKSAHTLYFEQIPANAEFETVFCCQTATDTAAGTYFLSLQFDYAYGKGMTGSGSGNAAMTVSQPVRMSFPQVLLPAEAVVSDRLELHIQAINLGVTAAQNVRAELKCDGLLPEKTAFLGSVSGGTSAECILNVQVSSKHGAEMYGETAGQLVFTYADESGREHTETQDFSLVLKSPFSERKAEPEQVSPKYWIWIMAGIFGGILLLTVYLMIRRRKRGQS